ncbi:MAG: hypothetical protein VYA30_03995 [Myxococcota bacterium]|nr:hypothetical protein [Myxococcota bacterium]
MLILPQWSGGAFASEKQQPKLSSIIHATQVLRGSPATVDALTQEALPNFITQVESAMRTIERARNLYFGASRGRLSAEKRHKLRQIMLTLQKTPQPILVYANDAVRFRKSIYLMLAKAYTRVGLTEKARMTDEIARLALERPARADVETRGINTSVQRP